MEKWLCEEGNELTKVAPLASKPRYQTKNPRKSLRVLYTRADCANDDSSRSGDWQSVNEGKLETLSESSSEEETKGAEADWRNLVEGEEDLKAGLVVNLK